MGLGGVLRGVFGGGSDRSGAPPDEPRALDGVVVEEAVRADNNERAPPSPHGNAEGAAAAAWRLGRRRRSLSDEDPGRVSLEVATLGDAEDAQHAPLDASQRQFLDFRRSEREAGFELFSVDAGFKDEAGQGYSRFGLASATPNGPARGQSSTGLVAGPGPGAADDSAAKLGTIMGVFIPCMQNILGIILFIRLSWIVGQAGIGLSLVLVATCCLSTFVTGLSLSAIATNGAMKGGGPYFLIGRALGPEVGVSIGLCFYLGTSVAASMYILGAVETLFDGVPSLKVYTGDDDDTIDVRDMQIYGTAIAAFMLVVVLLGVKPLARVAPLFLVPVVLSVLCIVIGICSAPRDDTPDGITGLKNNVFQDNWSSKFSRTDSAGDPDPDGSESWDFQAMLALFYPSVTGIMAGSNRSNSLRDPQASIPVGTLAAIAITSTLYLSSVLLYGSVAEREYLLSERLLSAKVAWPASELVSTGIVLSTVGAGLQSMMGAPRLLQAMANDDILPFLRPLKTPDGEEPRKALLVTWFITVAFVLIGNLDMITPIITSFFLMCYMGTNSACFLLDFMKAPNWRPRWRYYHWTQALFGTCLCLTIMFLISWLFTVLALAMAAFIFYYVSQNSAPENWGDGLKSLRFRLAIQSLSALKREVVHPKNWYPSPLIIAKPWGLLADDVPCHPKLMTFANLLKVKGQGLSMIYSILEGNFADRADDAYYATKRLQEHIEEEGCEGFAEVVVAPTFADGLRNLLQCAGLGGLKPNLVILRYPERWRPGSNLTDERRRSISPSGRFAGTSEPASPASPAQCPREIYNQFVTLVNDCYTAGKGIVLLKDLEKLPDEKDAARGTPGTIDLYWIVRDGGLMLLLAQLLMRKKLFANCEMRVFVLTEKTADVEDLERDVKRFLYELRMDAEVTVLAHDSADVCCECGSKRADMQQRFEKVRNRIALFKAEHGLEAKREQHGADAMKERGRRERRPSLPDDETRKSDRFLYTSLKLNASICLHSRSARLVLINLPPPPPNHDSYSYMEYLDTLLYRLPCPTAVVRGYRRAVVTLFS